MTILSVLAFSISFMARSEIKIASRQKTVAQSYYCARAGLHRTAAIILNHWDEPGNGLTSSWWSDPKLYRDVSFADMVYSVVSSFKSGAPVYGIDDEESRLNINIATPEMLMQFSGITSVLAEEILIYKTKKMTQDRVEPGDQGQINGPITRLEDLLDIPGMTREILFDTQGESGSPAQNLTCYSSGLVNINTAMPGALLSLGFSVDEVERIRRDRLMQTQPYESIDAFFITTGLDKKKHKKVMKLLTIKSSNFRYTCQARVPGRQMETVIGARLTMGESGMGFSLWQPGGFDEI